MVNRAFLLLHACMVAYVSCADFAQTMPHALRYFQEIIWQERFDYNHQIMAQNTNRTLQEIVHAEKLRHTLALQTAYIHVGGWQLAKTFMPTIGFTDIITQLVDTELSATVDAVGARFRMSNKQVLEQNTLFEHMTASMMLTLKYVHLLRSPSELDLQVTINLRDINTHGMAIAEAFQAALQTDQPTLTLHEPNENFDNSWHALCAMDSFLYLYAEHKRQLQLQHYHSSCNVL